MLNAISGLCKSDPEQADAAVVSFARYLRSNIDSMAEDRLVSFESELTRTENYVALEKIRFEKRSACARRSALAASACRR